MSIGMTVAFAILAVGGIAVWLAPARPPISGFAFTIGFLCSELAGHLLVVTGVLAAWLAASGWPAGPVGVACGALCALCLVSYGPALVFGLRSSQAVASGLEQVGAELDAPDAWLGWWRTLIALPIGHGRVTVHRDVAYVDDGEVAHRLDVYTPRGGRAGAPVLVFIHGGAWVIGSKREQCLPMLHELAARGWVCVTANYRLSPKATWPEHVVDVKRAIAWTRSHVGDFGGDPTRFLAVAGASAGGHLAALSALTWDDMSLQPGFEDADTRVDACVSLYGVLEMTGDPRLSGPNGRELVDLLQRAVIKVPLDSARAVYEAASPLHRLRADAPPFLVLHGTKDSLVPVAVARAFVRAFTARCTAPIGYVELPWAQHAFDLVCSPRCTATTRGVAAFLDVLVPVAAPERTATREPPPAPR